jgi:2'-5' RNA ligase
MSALTAAGFETEKRPYRPHLTLAREAVFKGGFDLAGFSRTLNPIRARIDKLSLMKSERLGGRLTYTEVV